MGGNTQQPVTGTKRAETALTGRSQRHRLAQQRCFKIEDPLLSLLGYVCTPGGDYDVQRQGYDTTGEQQQYDHAIYTSIHAHPIINNILIVRSYNKNIDFIYEHP